eukprot:gene36796-44637_t
MAMDSSGELIVTVRGERTDERRLSENKIKLNQTIEVYHQLSTCSNMSIDLETLNRILVRLQDAKNEELPTILSALIPKVLPLLNTAGLRDKTMAILTEALKRAKLHGCQLELKVFEDLVGPSSLPFACNFALAFVDSLDSLNQLTGVTHISLSKVLCAIAGHKQHAYQSNILLYFALKHCSVVDDILFNQPQLLATTHQELLKNILSDYYLDFCIADRALLSSPTANVVSYGLGDIRKERLLARKKPFSAKFTSETRILLLETQFSSLEIMMSIIVVCHCDSDSTVSTKADWRVNKLRDSGALDNIPRSTFSFLINLFFGTVSGNENPAFVPKRLGFNASHKASCLRFMLDLVSTSRSTSLHISDLIPVYNVLHEERSHSMHKEESDTLVRLLFSLMIKVISPE